MKSVVILGAGVAGLAAADRLLELGGCDVTVVEAEPMVGGLAATIVHEGIATDLGPHRIHTELPEVRTLLPDLVGDRLLRVRRSSRMYLDGRWISYPLLAGQVLLRLGPVTVARLAAGLAAARLAGLFATRQAATFEQAMKRALGGAAYRKVFAPYARKVWRTDPSGLSAEIARVRLPEQGLGPAFGRALRPGRAGRAGPVRRFLYVQGGIGQLCESLADRVRRRGGEILLQTRATELRFRSGQVSGVVARRAGKSIPLPADAVVSTIPLLLLGVMLPGGDAPVRAALASLESLAIVLVALVVARERIGRDHWLYFPQTPPLPTRACEPKNFDASLAPDDRSCLCCEFTVRTEELLWRANYDELAEQVEREIAATGLIDRRDIVSRFIIRKEWAYPVYSLGFENKLQTIWPYLASFPNLLSVGRQGLFNHNNIDHSLVMGRRAAETLVASPNPARKWYDSLDQFAHFRILD